MKRWILLLILISNGAVHAQTQWFQGTFEDAETIAAQENKRILVHFWSPF